MQPVFGYLDPATVTLIISAIVGAFAAAILWIRHSWYRIMSMFKRSEAPAEDAAAESDAGSSTGAP